MSDSRPNILLLFTDQQRFDTIAALGNSLIRTPVLDRLVEEGTAFTRCYTPSPVCVSARCSLMTGRPPHQTGCASNGIMPQDMPSFVEVLAGAGYQTHGVGKMHFTPDHTRMWGFQSRDISEENKEQSDDFRSFLNREGYGHVDEPNGIRSEYYYIPQPSQLPAHLHQTAWVADRSIDFLRRRDLAKPFFMMSSFIKPHPPFEVPAPWNKLYRPTDFDVPLLPENAAALMTYWNRVQNRYKYRDSGRDLLLLRTMAAAYYACISFVDYHIGRILDALGNEIDNTLVVFTSDHGEYLGDYGCFGKRGMQDVSARIPMLVRQPGRFAAGSQCDHPVSLVDLAPTFLDMAGAEHLPSGTGENLESVVQGASLRTMVSSQFEQGARGVYMITDGSWKYVHSVPDQKEWLFDLRASKWETADHSGDVRFQEILKHLRGELIAMLERDVVTSAVENGRWKTYPVLSFPADPDYGLLFQDSQRGAQKLKVGELAPYFRPHTVPPSF